MGWEDTKALTIRSKVIDKQALGTQLNFWVFNNEHCIFVMKWWLVLIIAGNADDVFATQAATQDQMKTTFSNKGVRRADAGLFNAWSVEYLSLIAFPKTNRAGKLISIFFASCVHWKTFCVPNISTLYIIWPSPFSLPSLPKMVVNLFSTGKWYSCWKK